MKSKYLLLFLLFFLVACERYESENVEMLHTDYWMVDFTLASGNSVVYGDTLYLLFGREEGGSAERPSKKMRYASLSDLSDFTEVPIALYSPHHGNSPLLPAGDFIIEETMTIPTGLMSGDYLGSMYLTNSLVEGIVDIPKAFVLEFEGCATPNGYQFSYNTRDGFLYLDK
jgi:hypothetical protein